MGVTLAIQHHHHVIEGCAFSGSGGLKLRTTDAKVWGLQGYTATVKAGERVKLHGAKLKKTKDATGDQVFAVEKLTRDYGPCPAEFASQAKSTR